MRIGVLALQGDYEAHGRRLHDLGASVVWVRLPQHLQRIAGLVIPGGESTTLLHFLQREHLFDALRAFSQEKPCFGTCAGAILLASEVENPSQPCLGAIDISVRRNAWGRQIDSHIHAIPTVLDAEPMEAVYIRAPRIIRTGASVEILARDQDDPVWVRQGRHMATTFHPELSDDARVHAEFLRGMQTDNG